MLLFICLIASYLNFYGRLTPRGHSFIIPKHSKPGDIYHEVELGVMLKKGGADIKRGDWKSYVGAYFLAIDYTDMTEAKRA